jgi:hypothetical protein
MPINSRSQVSFTDEETKDTKKSEHLDKHHSCRWRGQNTMAFVADFCVSKACGTPKRLRVGNN